MTNRYKIQITHEDNLLGVKIFKNGKECTFEDVVNDEGAQIIILDLIAQAWNAGYSKGICNDK